MRSLPSRLLLPAILCLPLLLSACATSSTRASLARTERPNLPTLPAELTRTEQLQPLTAAPTGELVSIDKGVLAELVERFAQAIGAVERGNGRAIGVAAERRCTAAILATGAAPADCPR